MTTDTIRHRIQISLIDDNGDPITGLHTRVRKLLGSSPLAYSLTETGLLFRDVDYLVPADGTIDLWVTDSEGASIKVFFSDGTLAYHRDVTVAFSAPDVVVVEQGGSVAATALILTAVSPISIVENNAAIVGAVLISSDGSTEDVSAELVGMSDDEDVATVSGGEIAGVTGGSATITYTVPGVIGAEALNAEVEVTVTALAITGFFAGAGEETITTGADISLNMFAVLSDGTYYNNVFPPALGAITSGSSNVAVATSNGRAVHAVGVGTCNITLHLHGSDAVVAITVVAP